MSRVVVVGAGVGGLAAAIRLAVLGHDVEVHERAASAGGKLAVYERDGFRFDTGPSLLTLPQVFTDLGLRIDPSYVDRQHDINMGGGHEDVHIDSVNMGDALVPLDPVVRHVFPDGTVLDSSSEHDVFLERIGKALGPEAAVDWDRFWRRAERIWQASWRSVLRRPVTPASLIRLSWRFGDLAAIAPGRSLRALGHRYLRDPRLRTMLDRYATYTGADPRRAPAALAAIPYAELRYGGWYLPGGLGTLATAMVNRCHELGVRIVLNSEVTAIEVADGRARGVLVKPTAGAALPFTPGFTPALPPASIPAPTPPTVPAFTAALGPAFDPASAPAFDPASATAFDPASAAAFAPASAPAFAPADAVVSDVDALALYRDLMPTSSRLTGLADRSLAGFVLLLGVRGDTPELAHHTVYFPTYYDDEFDAIFGSTTRRARPASDPTVFVTRAVDPAVHPAGDEAWFVLVNAPRHGTGWGAVDWRRPGLADAYGRHILDVLAERGLDVRDRLHFMETRTPADLADAAAAPGGAIYGTAGGLTRPANRGAVDGLHLVGGSVHPGGGLPMVTLSAQIIADKIGPA